MSAPKQAAIANWGMGNVAKIYLRFEAPWWDTEDWLAGMAFVFNPISGNFSFTEAEAAKDWTRGIGFVSPVFERTFYEDRGRVNVAYKNNQLYTW